MLDSSVVGLKRFLEFRAVVDRVTNWRRTDLQKKEKERDKKKMRTKNLDTAAAAAAAATTTTTSILKEDDKKRGAKWNVGLFE